MYKGKKLLLLFAAVTFLMTVTGGSLAYLHAHTGGLTNSFKAAEAGIVVEEKFDGEIKDEVTVKNTGDTQVYIRAAYAVYWKNAQGNVVAEVPSDYSYTLTENPDAAWIKSETENLFYYPTPVDVNDNTAGSLLYCEVKYPQEPIYTLVVEIAAEAIQSKPAEAVEGAWKVSVKTDGSIQK